MTQDVHLAGPTRPGLRPLDRSSVVPLYHQLFMDLRRRLLVQEWRPRDPFPKESEIEAAYEVSRITVRQALAQLVDANFVVRYRGRGSFVGNLPARGALVNHRSVAAQIEGTGTTASHRCLSLARHEASDLTARQLDIAVGAPVDVLDRLHLAGGEPSCLETVVLSADRFAGAFDGVRSGSETLTQAYLRLNIEVAKADQSVSAVILTEERRRLLALPEGLPALMAEQVGYSAANAPLDFRRLYYRGDAHVLRQEVIWGRAENRIL